MPRFITASLTSAAALVVVLSAPVRAGAAPSGIVKEVTDRVIAVLKDPSLAKPEQRTRIEDIVIGYVDFETLSKLVLARNWTRFSAPQQSEFMTQFQRHLALTYGGRIDDYRNEEVVIVGEREEARGDRTVKTKVPRAGEEILIDYRLRQRNGEWRIIDITIEGVSLVSNFRSQFQGIVSNGGPDRLIALLKDKNAKREGGDLE